MKEIPLTQGKVALIDDEDYERVIAAGPWNVQLDSRNGKWYAFRHVCASEGNWSMARFVMGLEKGDLREVDHRDRENTLDNRRQNLRIATHAENQQNKGLQKNNNSGLKGVTKRNQKWRAQIRHDGRVIHLGLFSTKELAAVAYDTAALHYHGEFAVTNASLGLLAQAA